MTNQQRFMRMSECVCQCHSATRQCNNCNTCVPTSYPQHPQAPFVDDDAYNKHRGNHWYQQSDTGSSTSSVSVSSLATEDNRAGTGRGLDKLFQYWGRRLERFLGVAFHRFGYGPAAEERNALSEISKLSLERAYYVEVVRGKMVIQVISETEAMRAERRITKYCRKLAKHLRSEAPTTQLHALNALWRLRCADPVRVDDAYREMKLHNDLHRTYDLLCHMDSRKSSDVLTLWKSEYVRPYDDGLLDNLLASSRKALVAVKDNELHSAAKSLIQLKGGYIIWIAPRYAHAVPQLQTLCKFLVDPDLGFMAVAYIGRLGILRSWVVEDKSMFLVSMSIVQTLRAVCSFCADRLSTEGQALPDAYRNVMEYLEWIVDLKVFLPVEMQRLISAAPTEVNSPDAVDWKHLERATEEAFRWIFVELVSAARSEGYHKFLERQRPKITGGSRQTWDNLKYQLARFWFGDFLADTFERHYRCANCGNQKSCEYWREAIDCFWKGGVNGNEVFEEFQKNSEDSSRAYALAQMNDWQRRTVFKHEHGERIRWVMERSV